MSEPIAVTSMAWRTPLGNGLQDAWNRLCAGERSATQEHRISSQSYRCRLGAALAEEPGASPHRRFLKRIGISALESAVEAFQPMIRQGFDKDRVGLFFSYGGLRADWSEMRNSLLNQQLDGSRCWTSGLINLHPYWILKHLSNNAHAITAQSLGICGEGVTLGGLNAGTQALAAAINALRMGAVDQALVVSHDSLLEPETLVALGEKGLLSSAIHPRELIAPYSASSSGFVPGEASAAVLLERAKDVKGEALANPLIQVEAIEAADGKPTLPTLKTLKAGLLRMKHAVSSDHVEKINFKVDLFDGAGLADLEWEFDERNSLSEYSYSNTPLTCTLSAMGQLGASSTLVQLIALVHALRSGTVHPIAGLKTAAKGCLSPVNEASSSPGLRSALAVNAGFPGLLGLVHLEVL